MTETQMRPFGMRYLREPRNVAGPLPEGIRYDHALQILVTAEGNPWASSTPGPESRTTTDRGDGQNLPEDDGTDIY